MDRCGGARSISTTNGIYYALQNLVDLLGGVQFTLRIDHNNLKFKPERFKKSVELETFHPTIQFFH